MATQAVINMNYICLNEAVDREVRFAEVAGEPRRRRCLARLARKIGEVDAREIAAEDDKALDIVFEFANVPGPRPLSEKSECFGRQVRNLDAFYRGKTLQKCFYQCSNIFGSFAQRWNFDRNDIEPIEEIIAKRSLFHFSS